MKFLIKIFILSLLNLFRLSECIKCYTCASCPDSTIVTDLPLIQESCFSCITTSMTVLSTTVITKACGLSCIETENIKCCTTDLCNGDSNSTTVSVVSTSSSFNTQSFSSSSPSQDYQYGINSSAKNLYLNFPCIFILIINFFFE
ncbi:unnamed protein product [Brachionus calyciflorus]|uniref:Snake toxin/toxin-like domain-containing protein n=1 Tax=Brachionus calyciflorus TaxID=104777 RepID=A0A813UC31_9BILA|nr:unnamed protein product [Brachionus calyciflorus]